MAFAGPRTTALTNFTIINADLGVCDTGEALSSATAGLRATVTDPSTGYTLKFYRDNVLQSSVALSGSTVSPVEYDDIPKPGYVIDGSFRVVNETFGYKVQLVKDATGTVVTELTANWTHNFGTCAP